MDSSADIDLSLDEIIKRKKQNARGQSTPGRRGRGQGQGGVRGQGRGGRFVNKGRSFGGGSGGRGLDARGGRGRGRGNALTNAGRGAQNAKKERLTTFFSNRGLNTPAKAGGTGGAMPMSAERKLGQLQTQVQKLTNMLMKQQTQAQAPSRAKGPMRGRGQVRTRGQLYQPPNRSYANPKGQKQQHKVKYQNTYLSNNYGNRGQGGARGRGRGRGGRSQRGGRNVVW